MSKLFIRLFSILFLFPSITTFAQGWGWVVGNTSTQAASPNKNIAIDKKGNLYVASMSLASSGLTNTFGPFTVIDSANVTRQGILVSTDSSGNYRWAMGTQNGGAWFVDIAADPADNMYVIGYSLAPFRLGGISSGMPNCFCAKVRSDGTVVWVKNIPYDVNKIAVDAASNVYIGGAFAGNSVVVGSTTLVNTDPGTYDVVVAKYDSSFNATWATSIGGDSTEYTHAITVANGDVYVSGSYSSTSVVLNNDTLLNATMPQSELFIAKLTAAGGKVWGRRAVSSVVSYTNDLYADKESNLYVVGSYGQNFGMGSVSLPYAAWALRMYLAKYDSAGNLKFLNGIADTALTSANNITGDDCGNIWMTGRGGHSALSPSQPMFLAKYDTIGTLIDTFFIRYGGGGSGGIALNQKGSVYVTSEYDVTMTLGSVTLSGGGSGKNMFIAQYKYAASGCNTDLAVLPVTDDGEEVMIYPNPAADVCTFYNKRGFGSDARVEIYDMTGRAVLLSSLKGTTTEIAADKLAAGQYLCKIYPGSAGNAAIRRLVIMR
jgi:hypothetical protein